RYIVAAHSVLRYAENEKLIPYCPKTPLLNEKVTRRYRDILTYGQDEIIINKLVEMGHTREAKLVDILIQTGLRQGELQKLTPEQVTVEMVPDAEGTKHECGVVRLHGVQTKNGQMRVAIFSAPLARFLKALIATDSVPNSYRLLDTFKNACHRAGIK